MEAWSPKETCYLMISYMLYLCCTPKSQENDSGISSKKKVDMGNVSVEDYNPIDPAPSSKASLKPGPIEHGSPLNPYIPRPSPPAAPTPGDYN